MTDQVTGFGAQQEPGQASEPLQQEPGTPEQPQLVTMDLLRQTLDDKFGQLERRLQSMTDKQENRLKKEVDKKTAALEEKYRALGLQVPDAARQRVIDETVLSYMDDDAKGSQPKAPSPELVAYVNQRAQKISAKAGVVLGPGDPEFTQVNQNTNDPDEYLESWERAVTSKKNRVQGVAQQPPAQNQPLQPTNPAARMPIAGSGAAGGGDLMQQYKRELAAVRPGSEEALQVRMRYRKQGLEI